MNILQTVGAIIATIVLGFQLADRASLMHRLALNLIPLLRKGRQMLRDWRLWRLYHPIYEVIVDYATVSDGGRRIDLPLKVRYISRDRERNTSLRIEGFDILMFHHDRRESSPYRLHAASDRYDEALPKGEVSERVVTVHTNLEAPAILGEIAKCEVIDVGTAWVCSASKAKKLPPMTFKVRVKNTASELVI